MTPTAVVSTFACFVMNSYASWLVFYDALLYSQVNQELKRLLVASIGEDMGYHYERIATEKAQIEIENEELKKKLMTQVGAVLTTLILLRFINGPYDE